MFVLLVFFLGILVNKDLREDEDHWRDFLSGDRKAVSQLFVKYYGDLYRYGFKINPCDAEVRDCIQELFFQLWKNRETLNQAVSVKKYLIVAFRRILFRYLKQYDARERRNEEYSYLTYHSISGMEEDIIHSETAKEKHDALNESLSELTKRQREVLFLKFYEGYNNREISEMTDLSYQRVCNIAHEALMKLRETV